MLYAPLVILCTIGLNGLEGCVKFHDKHVVPFYSLKKCEARVQEIVDEIMNHRDMTEKVVKKPWNVRGFCQLKVKDKNLA